MKVHIALLLVALAYGANYSIAKTVMPPVNPFAIMFCRVVGAGVLFWIFHRFTVNEKVKSAKDYGHLAICALFGVAINQMMFFKGLSLTNPINASVIMTTAPIMVLVASSILLKERLTLTKIIGILLGAIGALLLIGGTSFQFSSDTALGDFCILLNAASYATYLVIVKPLMKKYSAFTIIKWIFLFGFVMTFPFCWPEFQATDWQSLDSNVIWGIVFIVLAPTFLAYLLNAWTLQYVNPSVVGAYIYLQPILATIFATFMGQATLTPEKIAFAALIFVGVYLVTARKTPKSSITA